MIFRLFFLLCCLSWQAVLAQENPQGTLLGTQINSGAEESFPLISPDEKTLYFARKDHPQNIGKRDIEDIWISINQGDQNWSKAIQIGPPINDTNSNIPIGVNALGNTLYFWNKEKAEIYLAQKEGRIWQFPRLMQVENFESLQKHSNLFISADGNKLFFSALSPVQKNKKRDLYFCDRLDDHNWSAPKNLSADINTIEDETGAFLAPDNKTLYFSSKAFSSFGGYDFFISRRLDHSWTNWSAPVNMGANFNSEADEIGISVPISGERAYLHSQADIKSVPLPKEWQPEPVIVVTGKIINAFSGQVINAKIATEGLYNEDRGGYKDKATKGQFQIILPYGEHMGVFAEQEGYFPVSETMELGENQMEELDYDPYNSLASLNEVEFKKEAEELEGMQLRLKSLNKELIELNKKREAYKEELRAKAVKVKPQSDPELDALKHKYFNYQRNNQQDTLPTSEESVIPNNFNFMDNAVTSGDDELEDLKKRYRAHYKIEKKETDTLIWENEDFDEIRQTAEEELKNELKPLIRKNLEKELYLEVKGELRAELDEASWRKLEENENSFLKEIQSNLNANQRSDSKKNKDQIWQNKLKEDLKVALKDEVELALKEDMEDEVKRVLHSEMAYLAKKGVEEDMEKIITEKINKQKSIEENSNPSKDSLSIPLPPSLTEEKIPFLDFVEKEILLVPVEEGQIIPLQNVYFHANKATLKPESYKELGRVLGFLEKNESIRIEISGHTNGWLSYSQAQNLSEERAKVVMDYLLGNGIHGIRLSHKGYGKTQPIASNETEEGRKRNQRIELKILAIK